MCDYFPIEKVLKKSVFSGKTFFGCTFYLREAYGDSVRGLHGFPVMAGGLQDHSCIRALREIETWLAEADKRRQHTLNDTSKNSPKISS
jgi:hypothetical protein